MIADAKTMTTEEIAEGIMGFYKKAMYPLATNLIKKLINKDKDCVEIIDKLIAGGKDKDIDSYKFIWAELTPTDKESKCMVDTVLDVRDKRSMIYQDYHKMMTALVILKGILLDWKVEEMYRGQWVQFGYGEMNFENAIKLLETSFDNVMKIGGVFNQAKIKFINNDYELRNT